MKQKNLIIFWTVIFWACLLILNTLFAVVVESVEQRILHTTAIIIFSFGIGFLINEK